MPTTIRPETAALPSAGTPTTTLYSSHRGRHVRRPKRDSVTFRHRVTFAFGGEGILLGMSDWGKREG